MKTLFTIAAAALMATGVSAQVAGPADPASPPMENMQTAPPAEATMPADMATPMEAAPPAATAATLEQRDGKWWNGDRKATKAEIAEYKKLKKAGTPG